MGDITAHMRVLGADSTSLVVSQNFDPYMVDVPGFGVLIIGQIKSDQPIVRMTSPWNALLVQPDSDGRFGPKSAKLARDATVTDTGIEVEILPNSSGEERLVVVLVGATDASAHTEGRDES